MGLDNGICVRRNAKTNDIKELQPFIEPYENDFSICYWRKCYNIKNDILWVLEIRSDPQYEFEVTSENLGDIIAILASYNEDNWEGSIWDFGNIKEQLEQDIKNLQLLQDLMEKYELEVYFYDSY